MCALTKFTTSVY